jgi:alcohol dehydrogenase
MNFFVRGYCRLYQKIINFASYFLSFKEPEVIQGEGASAKIPAYLHKKGFSRPLIVTDPGIYSLGLCDPLLKKLDEESLTYIVYKDVVANPTFDCINEAFAMAKKNNCDSIIAIGGGSSMDVGKAVGALMSNPKKSLSKMRGILKVRKRLPLLIAIPTTAGTGSEATLAAVVVNSKTHEKFAIEDPKLIPAVAVLDSSLLKKLPKKIISSTGMDALTHAVESYIGHSLTKKTRSYAIEAVRLISDNLYAFYSNPEDEAPRSNMQRAAYLAGVSFTRSYVGYVHAIAHSLGGEYNVPHGLANAIILPYVLKAYGVKAEKALARLSDAITLTKSGASTHEKAVAFIAWIEDMNEKMGIPKSFDHLIKPEDISLLAARANKEANPLYPVPKEMNKNELIEIYKEIDPQ